MTHLILLLLLAAPPPPGASHGATQNNVQTTSVASQKDQAQAAALIGHNELQQGRWKDAQAKCDAALALDPGNGVAKDCLNHAAEMAVDDALNNASAKLRAGDSKSAVDIASVWVDAGIRPDQRTRARLILEKVKQSQPSEFADLVKTLTPDWLRQTLATIAILTVLSLLLLVARNEWRERKRGSWLGPANKTSWTMMPLRELPSSTDAPTGIPTDAVLDAMSRMGHQLERPLWEPKLLLLRPTPPANYEPAIISEYLSSSTANFQDIKLAPSAGDLCLEWRMHDVLLSQAVQNLQLKMPGSMDIGSVARFMGSLVDWFNSGAPSISGIAQTTDKEFSLHITARGGRAGTVAVSTSTAMAPGIDEVQISAERAAYKFLLRMRYPGMANEEVDGFAALRQGAYLFTQYAGTIPGVEDDANTRSSSLAEAAFNLEFFRMSIPIHCSPPSKLPKSDSITITDEIRQSVLLAEGVAHALIGKKPDPDDPDPDLNCAIFCFSQLQDWPGTDETSLLRQQAAYNEGILWRQMGNYGRSVLKFTDLLGERAPDTMTKGPAAAPKLPKQANALPDAIRIPARVARLSAFAQYTRDEWSTMPRARVKLLIDDAEVLLTDLEKLCRDDQASSHDRRLSEYMYTESLRAVGHVELLRVITGDAAALYQSNRPVGVETRSVGKDAKARLEQAIHWMLTCEQTAPNYDLYCDLAEAYLLLKDFPAAQGYARHATLQCAPNIERGYYLATESFFLQNTPASKALAIKYASDYKAKNTVTLEEFRSVCSDLGIRDAAPSTAIPKPPP